MTTFEALATKWRDSKDAILVSNSGDGVMYIYCGNRGWNAPIGLHRDSPDSELQSNAVLLEGQQALATYMQSLGERKKWLEVFTTLKKQGITVYRNQSRNYNIIVPATEQQDADSAFNQTQEK